MSTQTRPIKFGILFFLLSTMPSYLISQNNGVYKKLYSSIYISNSGSSDFVDNDKIHKATLKSLKNFYKDKRARSRSRAYTIARNIYNNSDVPEIKEQVVLDHLEACMNDKSQSLKFRLANHLIQFDKEHFTPEAIDMVKELIENAPNKRYYIVIAGYKELEVDFPEISDLSTEEIVESWEIIQAMARVGNPEALEICRKLVSEHPLDISFFDKILPGLMFTNDKMVFKVIIDEILADNSDLIGQRLKDYQRYFMLKNILPLIYEYPYHFVDEAQLSEDEFYQQLHFAMDWVEKNKDVFTLINVDTPLRSKKNPYLSDELGGLGLK